MMRNSGMAMTNAVKARPLMMDMAIGYRVLSGERYAVSGGLTITLSRTLSAPLPGVKGLADAVADEVPGEHDEEDGKPGKRRQPPGDSNELPARGEHVAPGGSGRLDAESEEAETGLDEDGVAHAERGLDDDGRHRVGQGSS